ncbi:alpha/beta hydrolase [uncultured Psychrobacillus sp.]|uniref:alpha/beta hydrolase family protein n=1 Tax=uncultured Psychrobacillus sp. TaxID=1551585 RepID=UPI0026293CF6|nr:alpha/beta hydrolase [uncultured Psychrobacillus sp.]
MNYKKALILSLLLFHILLSGCSDSDKQGGEEVSKDKEETSTNVSLEMVEGVWEGSIKVPNQPLPISIKFTNEEGLISIPIQGLNDHPLTNISLNDKDITFNMPLPGQKITFAGKLQDEKMAGTFTQQGQSFPFELTKVTDVAKAEHLEELEVNGGKMIGQIEIPEGEGRFPLMIILAGSGPTDRNGNSLVMVGKNNSLKMIAEELAAEGIASIRYDKRGVGLNMGLATKEEDLRFNHYIEDAVSWADFAKEDDRFSDIGFIGHSEGSLVGMIAAQEAGATVFVSLAGAGRQIDEILLEQLSNQLPSELMSESEKVINKLKQGEQVEEVSNELHSIFRPSVQPYMISWLQYNPIEQIKKLDARILLINGTADLQVPSSDAELLHQAKDSELLIIEKMNHVLKESPSDETGNMATYTDPSLPLAEGLMDAIIEFIK